MKPKLFVGSSREAINVANAIHENLAHDAEVTVWNQGIFNLSQSNLEALLEKLDNMDFGIFVFAPDDVVQIRDEENASTRDNVVFELGLFVGRLGRERSFFFLPSEQQGYRLPTDLIGTNPGVYESGRSDGNFVAATAVACNAVRRNIDQLAPPSGGSESKSAPQRKDAKGEERLTGDEETQDDEESSKESEGLPAWLNAHLDGDFERAIKLLDELIKITEKEDDNRTYRLYLGEAKAQVDFHDGIEYLEAEISEKPEDALGYLWLASIYVDADLYDKANSVVDRGIQRATDTRSLSHRKATLQVDTEVSKAMLRKLIEDEPNYKPPYKSLSEILIGEGLEDDAARVYEAALNSMPNDEDLLDDYGHVLIDQAESEAAIAVYSRLTNIKPGNAGYLTMLGNAYLSSNFLGLALEAYQKANEAAEGKQGWILANIGNLYNRVKLYPQAIDFLKRALEIESDSSYTHQRLSQAIQANEEQRKEADKVVREQQRRSRKLPSDDEVAETPVPVTDGRDGAT